MDCMDDDSRTACSLRALLVHVALGNVLDQASGLLPSRRLPACLPACSPPRCRLRRSRGSTAALCCTSWTKRAPAPPKQVGVLTRPLQSGMANGR